MAAPGTPSATADTAAPAVLAPATLALAQAYVDGTGPTELSRKYETQLGLAHTTIEVLKARIKQHYDLASDYYVSLWGEHIHHGYWPTAESKASESKETAQTNLIHLLLSISGVGLEDIDSGATLDVLDVGCGVGGTSRYLASDLGCRVTGITISTRQVEIATRLAASITVDGDAGVATADGSGFLPVGKGQVRFIELDAEKMGDYFMCRATETEDTTPRPGLFDVVWVSEALSHFPDKALFFSNAMRLLRPGGKLVLADWFKADGLPPTAYESDIKPIEDGMLLPPLCTQSDYVALATGTGLSERAPPKDISADVSKTWDISWALVQNPALWAFALSQGRDGIAFLQAFMAMRRGYSNGSFRYAVMCFEK